MTRNSLPDERHYIHHLAKMGDCQEIRVHEDIRNTAGMTLLGKGERVDGGVIDRILQHKLLKPIDHSIHISDGVTTSALVQGARQVMGDLSQLGSLLRAIVGETELAAHVGHLPLEPIVANKLTIMQNRLPALFQHSLESACLSVALGKLCGASERELDALAGIGLLHDIGNVHLDTTLFEPELKFTPKQWRQMYAHPVIGFMILKYGPGHYSNILLPVLEHHERMDGSGYPRKVDGSKISKLGRISAVVEMVLGVLQKHPPHHLAVVMKSQEGKLDDSIVQALWQPLRHTGAHRKPTQALGSRSKLESLCAVLGELLGYWQSLTQALEHGTLGSCPVLVERMDEVRNLLRQAGYSADYQSWLSAIETDAESLNEVLSVLSEAFYAIRQAVQETKRRGEETPLAPLCQEKLDKLTYWLTLADEELVAAVE